VVRRAAANESVRLAAGGVGDLEAGVQRHEKPAYAECARKPAITGRFPQVTALQSPVCKAVPF